MSRLNTRPRNIERTPEIAVSANGNIQFAKSKKQELYDLAVSTLLGKDTYYKTSDEMVRRIVVLIQELVRTDELDFIANLIVHARVEMNMRNIPIVMAVHFAEEVRAQKKTFAGMKNLICDVIRRADQLTDLLSYAIDVFGGKKNVPMAIRRGVAAACNKFDEYQFGKWNRDKVELKFRDMLRIVHPTPKDEGQSVIFKKIMEDELATPFTWETELSEGGRNGEAKNKTWERLLLSDKVGIQALAMNIRNMVQANVDEKIFGDHVCSVLSDPERIAKSKLFPTQLQMPYRILNETMGYSALGNMAMKALSMGIDYAVGNIPQLGERVWVIVDCSLSMKSYCGNTDRNTGLITYPIHTAALFAAALLRSNRFADRTRLTMFSDYAKNISVDPMNQTVLDMADVINRSCFGGGTNLQSALNSKDTLGFEPDTVILLSDMEVDSLSGYRGVNIFKPGTVKIAIDLGASGNTPAHELHGWQQLSGWSDKIFSYIPALHNGETVVQKLSVPYVQLNKRKK